MARPSKSGMGSSLFRDDEYTERLIFDDENLQLDGVKGGKTLRRLSRLLGGGGLVGRSGRVGVDGGGLVGVGCNRLPV